MIRQPWRLVVLILYWTYPSFSVLFLDKKSVILKTKQNTTPLPFNPNWKNKS